MCLYNKGEDVRVRKQGNCMVGATQLQNYNRVLGWRVNGGPGWFNSMTVRNI